MRYEKNRKIAGIDEFKVFKALKLLAIPMVVLVLIIVILVVDRVQSKKQAVSSTASQESVVAESSSNNTVYTYDFSNYGLQKDSNPEVMQLVAEYQKAKIEADSGALYKVFGKSGNEGQSDLQAKLNEEKKVYEAYENVACYIGNGLNAGEYVVFISADVKFHGIITPAPMLTWAYIKTGEDGKLYMVEPDKVDEQQKLFVDKVAHSEDVKLLDSAMRKRLAEVLISDAQLASLYQIWLEGADVSKYDISLGGNAEEESTKDVDLEDDEVHIGTPTTEASKETTAESTEAETTTEAPSSEESAAPAESAAQ